MNPARPSTYSGRGFTGVVRYTDGPPPTKDEQFHVDRLVCVCMSPSESSADLDTATEHYATNVHLHFDMLLAEATDGLSEPEKVAVRRYVSMHLPRKTDPPDFIVKVVCVWPALNLVAVRVVGDDDDDPVVRERCAALLSPPRYLVTHGKYASEAAGSERVKIDLTVVELPPPVDMRAVHAKGWATPTAERWRKSVAGVVVPEDD